jgi:hypothetical protein
MLTMTQDLRLSRPSLPLEVIQKVRSWTRNKMDITIGQQLVVTAFFAMRSCECSDMDSGRLPSVIGADDILLGRVGRKLWLATKARDRLRDADAVTIMFRKHYKNGTKEQQ